MSTCANGCVMCVWPHAHVRILSLPLLNTSPPPRPRFMELTWTLASVSLVLCASSSLVYTSGYCVLSKARSSSSSCSAVKVVLARRCFLLMGMPGSLSVSLSEIEPPAEDTKTLESPSAFWVQRERERVSAWEEGGRQRGAVPGELGQESQCPEKVGRVSACKGRAPIRTRDVRKNSTLQRLEKKARNAMTAVLDKEGLLKKSRLRTEESRSHFLKNARQYAKKESPRGKKPREAELISTCRPCS